MVAYNVMELISILIRNGLLLYNTQIPVFSSKSSYIFLPPTFFPFMFHFYVSTHWKSNVSRDETLAFYVSFLVSMFHFLFTTPLSKKLSGSELKPQWERFKTSMGEKSNPNGRNTTETLKSKMKHRMPMFHLLKVLIINALCYENETWNKKRLKVNIMYAYVRARKERVLTSRQRALTNKRRVLTWGRRVPASAFACQGSMPW